jgi:hypothetical protein
VRAPIALAALLVAPIPTPIGAGPRYHPLAQTKPVPGLSCSARAVPRFGVHIELFAKRRSMVVPAGIGILPPHERDGPYVRAGRCSYPLRTREPTGVIEIARETQATLGTFFRLWGQPLSPTRMASWRGRVTAFVRGRRWQGDPRAIPLTRHAQIVLQVGGYVRPHSFFFFRKGL